MPIDDKPLFAIRKDFTGGMNNRQHGSVIADNQATLLQNADISVAGEVKKRLGLTLIEDLGNNAGTGLYGFEPRGGTNELIATEDTNLKGYTGSSFTTHKSNFTAGTDVTMIKASKTSSGLVDVLLVKMSGNNWFEMTQAHGFTDLGSTTGGASDSPYDTNVGLYYRERLWLLKDNILSFSDVAPSDWSTAFNTSDNYKMEVGEERALIALRDLGIICFGEDRVIGINPSATPAATDKPERILDIGCVARKTVVSVGDDILFLARDGIRGLFRTQQDKVQGGASYPLSFLLKEEFESISWAYIDNASAVYFDNKYFISLPVDASTYNNEVWVFHPAFNAWVIITGWNVADWATMRINGQEKLYAIDSTDGKVYQAYKGYDDNGTAIDYDERGRKEDFGQPLITKSGGEVKIKAQASGDYDLTVMVSVDDVDWVTLGTMNLAGNAPTLPVSLPFSLADTNTVTGVFHLDPVGSFHEIRLRITHSDTNGSDDIKIFSREIVTFPDEYQSE